MEQINYDDFAKVEFKIGKIIDCIRVEGSEKLLKMSVDFGETENRTVFSGISKFYEPDYLIGKKTVFVTNVVPRKIMGEMSEAMIFAGSDEENLSILILDKELPVGTKVY